MPRGGKRPGAGRPALLSDTERWIIYDDFRKRWALIAEEKATQRAYSRYPQLALIAEKHQILQNIHPKFRTAGAGGDLSETVQELVDDIQDHLRDINGIPDDAGMSWKYGLPRRLTKEFRRPQRRRDALLEQLATDYSVRFNQQINSRIVEQCVEQCRTIEAKLKAEET